MLGGATSWLKAATLVKETSPQPNKRETVFMMSLLEGRLINGKMVVH
jgi:hypothetical protein